MTPYILFNKTSSTGSASCYVKDFQHCKITVSTSGVTTGKKAVFQFQKSSSETQPTLSSAKGQSNIWDYAQVIRDSDGTVIDGATGDQISGSDDTRIYELNSNGQTWAGLTLSEVDSGVTVYVEIMPYNSKNE